MNTIGYFLNQLEEPFKSQAINNSTPKRLEVECQDLEDAIFSAFIWDDTLEGSDYWRRVASKYSI